MCTDRHKVLTARARLGSVHSAAPHSCLASLMHTLPLAQEWFQWPLLRAGLYWAVSLGPGCACGPLLGRWVDSWTHMFPTAVVGTTCPSQLSHQTGGRASLAWVACDPFLMDWRKACSLLSGKTGDRQDRAGGPLDIVAGGNSPGLCPGHPAYWGY